MSTLPRVMFILQERRPWARGSWSPQAWPLEGAAPGDRWQVATLILCAHRSSPGEGQKCGQGLRPSAKSGACPGPPGGHPPLLLTPGHPLGPWAGGHGATILCPPSPNCPPAAGPGHFAGLQGGLAVALLSPPRAPSSWPLLGCPVSIQTGSRGFVAAQPPSSWTAHPCPCICSHGSGSWMGKQRGADPAASSVLILCIFLFVFGE